MVVEAIGPEAVARAGTRLADALDRVLVGKRAQIELALAALFARGHLLLEDLPGVGKTTLARGLAQVMGGTFRRVQGTADLLPTDVTGVSVFDQRSVDFVFRPGPLFANVVLMDEINRATPRTQAAVLEAMQEQHVTVDGVTRPLPRPFLVIATQNPIELEGTFPLPEAQLDRFMLRLALGYPEEADERAMVGRSAAGDLAQPPRPILTILELEELQRACAAVRVTDDVRDYLVRVARATRQAPEVQLGASPRATLDLHRACQARASLAGRGYVLPDDVKHLAAGVLGHRLVLTLDARLRGRRADDVLADILERTPVPVE